MFEQDLAGAYRVVLVAMLIALVIVLVVVAAVAILPTLATLVAAVGLWRAHCADRSPPHPAFRYVLPARSPPHLPIA